MHQSTFHKSYVRREFKYEGSPSSAFIRRWNCSHRFSILSSSSLFSLSLPLSSLPISSINSLISSSYLLSLSAFTSMPSKISITLFCLFSIERGILSSSTLMSRTVKEASRRFSRGGVGCFLIIFLCIYFVDTKPSSTWWLAIDDACSE